MIVLVALIGLALMATTPAGAAPYVVRSCDVGGVSLDRLWTLQRTAASTQVEAFHHCPSGVPDPYGSLAEGQGVFDTLGGHETPADGVYAEYRIEAAPGTLVEDVLLDRDFGNRDDYWTTYLRIDQAEVPSESCVRPLGEAFCRLRGEVSISSIGAHSIAYGIRCSTPWGSCPNGETLHRVWAIVRSATVTLEDLEAPGVGAAEALGLADGQWHRGSGVLTFSASDNTGVRVRRVVEGATVRSAWTAPGAADGGCGEPGMGEAYTYVQPCLDGRGLNGRRSMVVPDVCAWGDGVHQVRPAAVDTGGGTATSPSTVAVKVDCSPPVVSIGPAVDRNVAVGAVVSPTVSAIDARVAVATTETQVQVGTLPWAASTGPVQAAAGSWYRFRARATDALGNQSAWVTSAWTRGVRVERPATPVEPPPATPQDALTRPVMQPALTTPENARTAPATDATTGTQTPAPATSGSPATAVARSSFTAAARRTTKRTVTVRGMTPPAYTGRVAIALTVRAGRHRRRIKRTTIARFGGFTATIRLPRRTTKVRILTVTARPLEDGLALPPTD